MITNLVCSVVVSLVTNVTEVDNHVGCPSWGLMHPWHEGCGPYKAPTEKTNVVAVLRVTEVRFKLGVKDWVCRDEEVVSESKKRFELESAWREK